MERKACQHRLDAYKCPVLTLPNEIVSEIFTELMPPYPACPPLTGLSSPTHLARICRTWREIALATPMLWRAISTSYTAKEAEQTRAVQTWLERSRSCQLSIQLVMGDEFEAPNPTFVAILLHSGRWQHVELELAASEVALIKGPMPLLETLSLAVGDFHYTQPTTSWSDFPRLRAVTLDDTCHGEWLPISQLTSLTFENVDTAEHYLPLLHSAANLVRLNLINCDPSDIPARGSVKLARLGTLVLFNSYAVEAPDRIFEMFTLPSLRTLHISGQFLGRDPSASLDPFIARSGCQLQQVLVIGEYEFSEGTTFPSIPDISFDMGYTWDTEKRGLRNAL